MTAAQIPEVLTFEQFAIRNNAGRWSFQEPGLHTRGHMSDTAHRRAMQRYIENGERLAEKRNLLRKEYAAKLESGEIREPTRTELLIITARGHSDNENVRAARRLLKKRGIEW